MSDHLEHIKNIRQASPAMTLAAGTRFRPISLHGVEERAMRVCLILMACLVLAGCGLVAAPCRVASAGLKIVPLVGHAAAAPTDACAEVIDPGA
jgi:hypothetical protein